MWLSTIRLRLWRLTKPATPADAAGDLAARALHAVIMGLLLWMVVFFAILLPFGIVSKLASAAVGLGLLGSLVASLWCLRRGRVRLASWIFISAVWVLQMVLIVFSGGPASPLLTSGLVVVVTAAWLLGRRIALAIASACVAVTLALAVMQDLGFPFSRYLQSGPLMTWAIMLVSVAIAILPLNQVLEALNRALSRAQQQVEDLTRAEEALRQSQAQVKESEHRYRVFISTTSEALWRIECGEPIPVDLPEDEFLREFYRVGRYSESNDAYARMKGRVHGSELAGALLSDIMPPSDPQRLEQMRQVLHAGLHNESVELHDELPDGAITFRVVTPTPIVESGRMVQLWGISNDITRLKQTEVALRESERRYRTLFDCAPNAILLMRDGRVAQCNPKSEELFGLSAERLIGLSPGEFSPPHQPDGSVSREQALDRMARAVAGQSQFFEWRHIRSDGVPFDAEVGLNPVLLANGIHLLAIVRDVTERKQREQELRELKAQLERENLQLREVIHVEQESGRLVGESQPICRVLEDIRTVAPTGSTVLILGETGVGKELVARAVHQQSLLQDKPLIKVNCAALASSLIESEFFGHERGAFTGAVSRKRGRFELADGGTIFLDEVGDLPLAVQAKLLRVLQDGEFERVGGTQTLKVNVRVIAATNRHLHAAVRSGSYRADLFYRLNVFPIEVPPLRERRRDIPLLVQYFLAQLSRTLGKPLTSITPRSFDVLMAHDWPGNVRELFHVLERAAIRTQGTVVELEDFGKTLLPAALPESSPASQKLEDVERTHILEVLRGANWVIEGPKGAAAQVGLHPNTLRYRMKKLGIERPARP